MTSYVESSAALAWLLGESAGAGVARALARSGAVVSSTLTLVEVDRALVRAAATQRLSEAHAGSLRARFEPAASHWHLLAITPSVVDRARRPFPNEPVRSVDAIHLASALEWVAEIGELTVLSLDDRVRANARHLGFPVLPSSVP